MALTLTYKAETSVPVEIEGLTPSWAADKSLAEIAKFEIFDGNQKRPLGEMFSLSGDAGDLRFEFEGDLSGVHWIGAHLTEGEIRVHGPAGRHVGSEMRGGEIHVHGNAGGWAGAEMHGGLLHIRGNAGHLVGAAYRGSPKGMTGGTILVEGNVGNEVGLSMRRGLIAVGGNAGDMLGFNMLAGTVVALGACGIRPGAGMRRGTLALLGDDPPQLLPSFRYACTVRPEVVPLLANELHRHGFGRGDQIATDARVDVFSGDMVALGKGEVLLAQK